MNNCLTFRCAGLLAGLLLLVSLPAAAQYDNVPDWDVFDSDERRYGHLEYFGFYASAMGNWNFTEELAPFTNLTWIHVDDISGPSAAIDEFVLRLGQAHGSGVHATLSLEPFLFLNEQGDLRPEAEIEEFLVELRARLEFEGLLDTVAMIYPKDEPFREFVRARDPDYYEQYVTGEVYAEIHAILLQVNALIKLVFPDKPIGVILSGHNLTHRFFSIPENYDWVGFDCYDNLFRSCEDRSFVQLYGRLIDFMQPHQKLMAVPETWVLNEHLNRSDWPDVLLSRLRHHYEIALNEPRFVAFVPFIWSFDADNETPGLGLNRFPELFDDGVHDRGTAFVDAVRRIGIEIKTGALEFPNMAYRETEDTVYRPPQGMRGAIMGVSGAGVVSAWAVDDALPHKNLRVQVIVRDAGGRLIHKAAPERTFIRDGELSRPEYIGSGIIGVHGYRYQIPRIVLEAYRGRRVQLDLVVYADGPAMALGHIHTVSLDLGYRIGPPSPLGQSGAGGDAL
jgi:hypothetical protein